MDAASDKPEPLSSDLFRWQAYFQKSTESLFFLNRQRRLLFVNRAWETLTGLPLREVRGLACRRRPRDSDDDKADLVAAALAPTADVLQGQPARVRRLIPASLLPATPRRAAPQWWEISFFPFAVADKVLGILGKITVVAAEGLFAGQPLPEKLVALRQRFFEDFDLGRLDEDVPILRRLAAQVRLAAQTRTPALLLGERGAGKEWTARCIHWHGPDRDKSFVAMDCERLPAQAAADLLFGPGGLARRLQPGTIYLREPGALPREIQDRLCRLLPRWNQEENPGPRVLAGTWRNPDFETQTGRLLPEFHCALSPLTIAVPPLRERLPSLPGLLQVLLRRAAQAAERSVAGFSEEASELLRSRRWPGNVTELYQVILEACSRARGERIETADLPFHLRSAPVREIRSLPLDSLLEQVEKRLLMLAMRQCRNNKTEAAELLSIWRSRLIRRLEALGIASHDAEPESSEQHHEPAGETGDAGTNEPA
jgi:transcriptional regulator with AAA-type ATPase domain